MARPARSARIGAMTRKDVIPISLLGSRIAIYQRLRQEDRIALGVDAILEAALKALTLDDFVLLGTLAEIDPCRVPGRGQYMRCRDLQIVVQDIGLRQMQALDDVQI